MEYRKLGKTDLKVSQICLGSLTFGRQNDEQQSHQQLDYAVDMGINFFDTAELYPAPHEAETYGESERIIGRWLTSRKNRDKVIIATKIAGPGKPALHIRGGKSHFTQKNIEEAVNDSLERLQTEYIDLYQLHWPDRATNSFGRLGYVYQPDEDNVSIEETLESLNDIQKTGKVRHFGLCNETPWAVMRFLHHAEKAGLVRMVSIQTAYNLLDRTFEIGLAEIVHREEISMLAYSPLAFGVLSGKYLKGKMPLDGKLTLWGKHFSRYRKKNSEEATEAYVELAESYQVDPAQMAMAFVNSRPFVTSMIIGATKMAQLQANIASVNVALSANVLEGIDAIHKQFPNPCP